MSQPGFTRTLKINSYRLLAFSLLLLCAGPQLVKAQVDAGSIVGTIRDTSGGLVGGAKVTLRNEDTGLTQDTATNKTGEYTFDPIKIGHYAVSAELTGFQKVEQAKITVTVQQHVLVDLTLTPGQTTQTVMVSGEVPQLQTQDAAVGQIIEAKTINDLPLNGRNFTFLAQLSAGVTQDHQSDSRRPLGVPSQ